MIYINSYELNDLKYYYYEDQLSFSDFFKEKLNINFKVFLSFLNLNANECYVLFEDNNSDIDVINRSIVIPPIIIVIKDAIIYSSGVNIIIPDNFVKGVLYIKNITLENSSRINLNDIKVYLKYTDTQFESIDFSSNDIKLIEIDVSLNISKKFTEIRNAISDMVNLPPHTHNILDVQNLQDELYSKSNIGHIHSINDVSDLQTQLDLKSDINHTHSFISLTDVQGSFIGNKKRFLRINHFENMIEYYDLIDILYSLPYVQYVISTTPPSNPMDFMQYYNSIEDKLYVFYNDKWLNIPFDKIVMFYPEYFANRLRINNGFFEINVGDSTNWIKCYPFLGKSITIQPLSGINFILQPEQSILFTNSNFVPVVFNSDVSPLFYIDIMIYEISPDQRFLGFRLSNITSTYNVTQLIISNGPSLTAARTTPLSCMAFSRKTLPNAPFLLHASMKLRIYNTISSPSTISGDLLSNFAYNSSTASLLGQEVSYFSGFNKSLFSTIGAVCDSSNANVNYINLLVKKLN